jgi:hypothetical protein
MREESRLITNPRLRTMEAGRGCWRGRFDAGRFEWQLEASSTSHVTSYKLTMRGGNPGRRRSAEHEPEN